MNPINPPFNYTGSKFKLLEQIVPHFDTSKKTFIDLFAGGGSVYSNVVHLYENIWVNDIIEDLISIHRLLLHEESFVDIVKNLCVDKKDKEGYLRLRDSYNVEKTPEKLYALMLCCTNNMMRFNKSFKFNQTFGERSYNTSTEKKIFEWKNQLVPHREKITFNSKHFSFYGDLLDKKDYFVYVDPPYYNTEAGYNAYWSENDEIQLYSFLKKWNDEGGTFAISGVLGEHKKGMKNSYVLEKLIEDGHNKIELDFDYKKVSRSVEDKKSSEVLIKNY